MKQLHRHYLLLKGWCKDLFVVFIVQGIELIERISQVIESSRFAETIISYLRILLECFLKVIC